MARYVHHFPSLSDAVHFIDTAPNNWGTNYARTNGESRDWDLNAGYQGALALARDGWKEGTRALVSGLERLRPQAKLHTRELSFAGSRAHVARFSTGNPRCMVKHGAQEQPKPAITLLVNVATNCGTSAQAMSNYGLAIASYAERLGKLGYPVEVIACAATGSKNVCVVSWTVKRLNAPMNFADMAFSIGHPAAYRRLGFAMWERSDCPFLGHGYGSATVAKDEDYPNKRNLIRLEGIKDANRHSRTPESALDAVSETIRNAMQERGL